MDVCRNGHEGHKVQRPDGTTRCRQCDKDACKRHRLRKKGALPVYDRRFFKCGHERSAGNITSSGKCRECNSGRQRIRSNAYCCANGHVWTRRSEYVAPNGQRVCRRCRAASTKRWKEREADARREVARLFSLGGGI